MHFDRPANVDHVREQLATAGYDGAQVQTYGSGSDLLVRLQTDQGQGGAAASNAAAKAVLEAVHPADNTAHITPPEFVDAQLRKALAPNAVRALLFLSPDLLLSHDSRIER